MRVNQKTSKLIRNLTLSVMVFFTFGESVYSQKGDLLCFLIKSFEKDSSSWEGSINNIKGVRFMLDTSGRLLRVFVTMKGNCNLSKNDEKMMLKSFKKVNYRIYMPKYLREEDLRYLENGDVVYYISVKYVPILGKDRCDK